MSSSNNNFRNLTIEQQRLLSMYISQYEQTNTHIDLLFNMLDEIRQNIINITQSRYNSHNRNNRNNTNNTNNRNNRNLNSIFNPILNNRYNFFNNDDRTPFETYYNWFNMRNRNNYEFIENSELTSLLNTFLNTRVVVRPTTEQIENASRLIRYRDIENPLAEFCPISLEEFNDDDEVRQILHCGHIFHQNQFQQWFESNSRCPICRYNIRNYTSLNNNNNNNTDNNNNNNNNNNNDQSSRQTTSETTQQNVRDINQTSRQGNRNNLDTSSTSPISNIELLRNPVSNQIEQFSFDINEPSFTNIFLDQISRNILNNLYTPNDDNNGRIMIDPSNNYLFYETIIRPNRNQNNN
jgi:hypothetical protein